MAESSGQVDGESSGQADWQSRADRLKAESSGQADDS